MSELPSLDEYLADWRPKLMLPSEVKYTSNLNNIALAKQLTVFLTGIKTVLERADFGYSKTPGILFPGDVPELKIYKKSYNSVLNKVYRLNCLWNKRYGSDEYKAPIAGKTIYCSIDDLVRSRMVTRYLDGPGYLAEAIQDYAQTLGLTCAVKPTSNDRGYYAWHLYVKFPANVIIESEPEQVEATLEIQITTQLAEVLTILTHGLYEDERLRPRSDRPDEGWQWDPTHAKFKFAYMGHALHMLEGNLLEMKDAVLGPPLSCERSNPTAQQMAGAPEPDGAIRPAALNDETLR